MAFGVTCAGAASVVRAVRAVYDKTLIVKLSPNVTDITEIARAVEAEGADSISMINTLLGMAIDAEKRRPVLSTITGGLSGPAVKPIALRMVWQTAQAVKVPIIGMGGIASATDAIEFLLAGASAVEVRYVQLRGSFRNHPDCRWHRGLHASSWLHGYSGSYRCLADPLEVISSIFEYGQLRGISLYI